MMQHGKLANRVPDVNEEADADAKWKVMHK